MTKFELKCVEQTYNSIKNNKLSDEEITKICRAAFWKKLTPERLSRILTEAQLIRDNKVTLEEFINLIEQYKHVLPKTFSR